MYGPKSEPRPSLKKAFLSPQYWILAISECHFLKIEKNCSQLSPNHFYVSDDAVSYTQRFPGP